MCGICGIVYNDDRKKVSDHYLENMCSVIKHRGPDDQGTYIKDNIALGMRRLKVIDLETGNQPLFSGDKKIILVFNGEIYNYKEIKKKLKYEHGTVFKTKSDTEVILKLYEIYGEKCLSYLNGMFAIAIWDGNKEQLFLARDRLGEKPLHYSIDGQGIKFASEIKSIVSIEGFDRTIDCQALYYYFFMLCVPSDATIYRNIKKLAPGHYIIYRKGKIQIQKYWDVEYKPDYTKTEQQFCEEIDITLEKSIKNRMISDVPLGAFLSGGIDSSVVVGYMSKISNTPIKTFSIAFKEKKYDESSYARKIATRNNTDHTELIVEANKTSDLIEDIAWYFDEPFGGPSAIPTYVVSKMAREYVTVVLTGDGGDEVFAGYDSYMSMIRRRSIEKLPLALRKLFFERIGDLLPDSAYGKRYLQSMGMSNEHLFMGQLKENWEKRIFNKDFLEDHVKESMVDYHIKGIQNKEFEYLSKFQYLDTKNYLPNNVLVKVDRMSMANALETRTVFLDHDVVELAARIPEKYKINKNISKYILKKAARKYIPDDIANRKKMGFALPIDIWFRKELNGMISDIIHSEKENSIFNYDYLKVVLKEHVSGRRDYGKLLWSILMYDLWKSKWG